MPDEAPYDPYIPSGQAGGAPQQGAGNARTQALQAVGGTFNVCDYLGDGIIPVLDGVGLVRLEELLRSCGHSRTIRNDDEWDGTPAIICLIDTRDKDN